MLDVLKDHQGNTIVMAVDPGRTTGVAFGSPTGMQGGNWSFDLLHTTNVEWDQRHNIVDWIVILQALDKPYQVVVESFNLYPGAAHGQAAIRSDFPSIRIIGLIDATRTPFVLQAPAIMKRVTVLPDHVPILRGSTPHIRTSMPDATADHSSARGVF